LPLFKNSRVAVMTLLSITVVVYKSWAVFHRAPSPRRKTVLSVLACLSFAAFAAAPVASEVASSLAQNHAKARARLPLQSLGRLTRKASGEIKDSIMLVVIVVYELLFRSGRKTIGLSGTIFTINLRITRYE
jgi:hypothetical protein